MFYRNYIDLSFSDYLNRHIKGIILLKDTLKKIHVNYELSEAFSNYACRFLIDVDFHDINSLSEADRQVANECFHNMWNSTGSKFVSFSYKPQRMDWVDFDEINSFITHYTFAKELIGGAISGILPPTCSIEITSLEGDALFLYTDRFLKSLRSSRKEKDMETKYLELNDRSFDFDCIYHNILKETADKYSELALEETVTDKELKKINGCHIEDLRRFVLQANIPFNIEKYSDIIDLIKIDMTELKKVLQSSGVTNSHLQVNPSTIIKYINQKEKQNQDKLSLVESISNESNVRIGNYILVQRDRWGKECNDLGIVKRIGLHYNNQLEVHYVILKNDLGESKLPLKETLVENISYSIDPSKVEDEKENLKKKHHLIDLLKHEGKQNVFFKVIKAKRE
ncbi:hypothetical protein [Chitinophaga sp. 212800010-3]|uniref:hypothetical protein n=1 Tax=unclassified Chitinophaga TaxID=2619133 RepID=UPI002DF16763|nr:hypothetical protein [Chitinophaga sp. 212800010-3]